MIIHRERIPVAGDDVIGFIAANCDAGRRGEILRDVIGQDYTADPHGRPVVEGRSVSISHTGEILAVALRDCGKVGIDVEPVCSPRDIDPLPEGLSPAERAMLMSFNGVERCLYFTRIWTAKEAIAKALGLGVSMDFSQIDISADGERMKLAGLYGKPELAGGWIIVHRELRVIDEVIVAAVAFDAL